ncbi:hypothetical protein T492DRAFT_955407 [Pavlovales sp. CCMP2436]|nr:hypothetical protein T492DRAFT_955407 [Pavlovales sp. CCMP2436]
MVPVLHCLAHTHRADAVGERRRRLCATREGLDAFAAAHEVGSGSRFGSLRTLARIAALLTKLQRAEDACAHWAVRLYVCDERPLPSTLRRALLACAESYNGELRLPASLCPPADEKDSDGEYNDGGCDDGARSLAAEVFFFQPRVPLLSVLCKGPLIRVLLNAWVRG